MMLLFDYKKISGLRLVSHTIFSLVFNKIEMSDLRNFVLYQLKKNHSLTLVLRDRRTFPVELILHTLNVMEIA